MSSKILYYCNLDCLTEGLQAEYMALLPEAVRPEVLAAGKPLLRRQRLAARLLLALHLGDFGALSGWERNADGKPALPALPDFSISHSGDWVLLAVGAAGVDAERGDRPLPNPLPQTWLHPDEIACLHQNQPPEFWLERWTRKEAWSKYLGGGLLLPLHELCTLQAAALWRGRRFYFERHDLIPGYLVSTCTEIPSEWTYNRVEAFEPG